MSWTTRPARKNRAGVTSGPNREALMPLREPLWVAIDFGADHRVLRSFVPPAEDPLLWEGPFETWGEAKRFICSVGAAEAKEIATKTAWWRAAKLVDVLEDDDAPA